MPRLVWPIGVDSVAVPITQTAAVRMPGHDHRQSQRHLHHAQRLQPRHADALRGFRDGRVDGGEAGDGVSQHRQHAVERERQHRGQEAQRREAEPEPVCRERRRAQAAADRTARAAPIRARSARCWSRSAARRATPAAARQTKASGRLTSEAKPERRHADEHVVAEVVRQVRKRVGKARVHQRARSPRNAVSRSAWRRGVCISSRT